MLLTEEDHMFLVLGQACGYLTRPSLVDALTKALDMPDSRQTRTRLLELHATLGMILGDTVPTSH